MWDCDNTEEMEVVAPPVGMREWLAHLVRVQVEHLKRLHVSRR